MRILNFVCLILLLYPQFSLAAGARNRLARNRLNALTGYSVPERRAIIEASHGSFNSETYIQLFSLPKRPFTVDPPSGEPTPMDLAKLTANTLVFSAWMQIAE